MASTTHPEPASPAANPVKAYSRRAQGIYLAIGLVAIVTVMVWIQFSTPEVCCADFDGYYHMRWSRLLWDGLLHGDFPPQFTWLPLTALNERDYADQHFFYHVLLIPFTWMSDLRLGAKLAAVFYGSLAFLSCFWLVLRYRLRYPLVWLLALLAGSALFMFRMSMTRAPSLSVVFLMIGFVLLFEHKYRWLGPTAFLYVWSYNLFVLLGVATVLWVATVWWAERQMHWRPLFAVAIGTLAGLLINPFFPQDLLLFWKNARIQALHSAVMAGGEWYPLYSWLLVKSSVVAFAAMGLGYVAFGYLLAQQRWGRQRLERPILFLLFSSMLLVLTLYANRFAEYWPPLAVLFLAFTLEAILEIPKEGEALPAPEGRGKARGSWAEVAVAVLLGVVLFLNGRKIRETLAPSQPLPPRDDYEVAAQWLKANVPAGEMIFNVNWVAFPKLFFYDTIHRYTSGLDPVYLLDPDPRLGFLYERISEGAEPNAATLIPVRFGARYVVVGAPHRPDSDTGRFFTAAKKDPKFHQVYDSRTCAIFVIRD